MVLWMCLFTGTSHPLWQQTSQLWVPDEGDGSLGSSFHNLDCPHQNFQLGWRGPRHRVMLDFPLLKHQDCRCYLACEREGWSPSHPPAPASLKQHLREILFAGWCNDKPIFIVIKVYPTLFSAYKAHFVCALPHLYYVVHHLRVQSNSNSPLNTWGANLFSSGVISDNQVEPVMHR